MFRRCKEAASALVATPLTYISRNILVSVPEVLQFSKFTCIDVYASAVVSAQEATSLQPQPACQL